VDAEGDILLSEGMDLNFREAVYARRKHLIEPEVLTAWQEDISKANFLKSELDKWNVYKEYEDRFLDLFREVEKEDN